MREKFATSLKEALKAKDVRRVSTVRLIQAAIKDRDIANRGAGKDPVHVFQDGYLRAQPLPDRAHLQAHDARADYDQMSWRFVERQRFGRADDALSVDFDARQAADLRARGDHHRMGP